MPTGRDLITAAVRAFEARDRDQTAALLGATVAENPPLGDTWSSVARLASLIGETSTAVTAARRFVQAAPGDQDRRLFAGAIMATNGRVEEAATMMAAVVSRHPDDPRLRHFLGTCRAQLGQTEAAVRELRRSLALQQTGAAAISWLTLVDLKTFERDDDPDLKALIRLVNALNGADDMQSMALYALGKAHDDLGDVKSAFGSYARGAAVAARHRRYDSAGARAYVDRMIAGSTAAHQVSLPQSDAKSDRPIFVVGSPRSGSTLVEQILVSHSAVKDGGELNLFQRAALGLGAFLPSDQQSFARRSNADAAWTAVGQAYLHLLDQRFGPSGRIVDKTLNHTRIVGLIASILPGARFIWLRRDPAATAWSCFKTHFNEGVDWSWSQEDIACYLQDDDRLHAHWTALLPESILTVPYEGLVVEPDQWISKILDHCGLADETITRAFHKTRRAVQTASVSQVRRPLYTTAAEDWRRYEHHLRPFLNAYQGQV